MQGSQRGAQAAAADAARNRGPLCHRRAATTSCAAAAARPRDRLPVAASLSSNGSRHDLRSRNDDNGTNRSHTDTYGDKSKDAYGTAVGTRKWSCLPRLVKVFAVGVVLDATAAREPATAVRW